MKKNNKIKMDNKNFYMTVFLVLVVLTLNVCSDDVNLTECNLDLNSSNNYFLVNDINYTDLEYADDCFYLPDNVIFDCQNHFIYDGILSNGNSALSINGNDFNIIIKNCVILNFGVGLFIYNSTNISLINVQINNSFFGINIYNEQCDLNYINCPIFENQLTTNNVTFNNNYFDIYGSEIGFKINNDISINNSLFYSNIIESQDNCSECENLTSNLTSNCSECENNLSSCENNLTIYQNYTTFFNESFVNCSFQLNNTNLSLIECLSNLSSCNTSNCSEYQNNLTACNLNLSLYHNYTNYYNQSYVNCSNDYAILNISFNECESNLTDCLTNSNNTNYTMYLECESNLSICNINLTEYANNYSVCLTDLGDCMLNLSGCNATVYFNEGNLGTDLIAYFIVGFLLFIILLLILRIIKKVSGK